MRAVAAALACCLAAAASAQQANSQAPAVSFTQESLDACQRTKEYLLYDAEAGVVMALQELQDYQDEQKEQRKITAVSGVRNLSEEYAIGSRIVGARALLADSWNQYRAAGGKAKSPKAVTVHGPDPCPDPREQLPPQLRQ